MNYNEARALLKMHLMIARSMYLSDGALHPKVLIHGRLFDVVAGVPPNSEVRDVMPQIAGYVSAFADPIYVITVNEASMLISDDLDEREEIQHGDLESHHDHDPRIKTTLWLALYPFDELDEGCQLYSTPLLNEDGSTRWESKFLRGPPEGHIPDQMRTALIAGRQMIAARPDSVRAPESTPFGAAIFMPAGSLVLGMAR